MDTHEIENEVVDFLQELVRAPGVDGDLAAVAGVAVRRMRSLGFDDVWQDEIGNVIGVRRGSHPGSKLVFDAHMDTVEVGDRSAWKHDPFGGELSEGKVWGRGATDDKGSLAAFTVALASLPRGEIYGEVYAVGSLGEEKMEGAALNAVLDAVNPDCVIIGEPTDCRLGIGHKGRTSLTIDVKGKSAHTSSPEVGENSIDKAMEVVRRIRQIPPVNDALFGNSVMEPIQIISSPFPSVSTIPYACQIIFDRRMVRGETRETVLNVHRKALEGLSGFSIEFQAVSIDSYTGKTISMQDFHPAWVIDVDSVWVQAALEALNKAGLPAVHYGTPYCTNGSGSAGERGIPTIVFGPCSVHLAHVTDEYAEVSELVRSVRGFTEIAKSLGKIKR